VPFLLPMARLGSTTQTRGLDQPPLVFLVERSMSEILLCSNRFGARKSPREEEEELMSHAASSLPYMCLVISL
jgi:hypothetical protein